MTWVVDYTDHNDIPAWKGFAEQLARLSPIQDDLLVDTLAHFTKGNEILLDLGCSSGIYTELWDKQGYNCIGVDQIPEAIMYASKRVPNAIFIINNITELNLSYKVDIVFTRTVIQHVRHELKAPFFEVIHKHLKPNGLYYMVEDCLSADTGWYDLDILTNEDGVAVKSNYVYTPQKWKRLVESFGFKCIKDVFDKHFFLDDKYKRYNMIFQKV